MSGVLAGVGRSYLPLDVAFMDRVSNLYDSDDDQEPDRLLYRYVPGGKADVLGGDIIFIIHLCYRSFNKNIKKYGGNKKAPGH